MFLSQAFEDADILILNISSSACFNIFGKMGPVSPSARRFIISPAAFDILSAASAI